MDRRHFILSTTTALIAMPQASFAVSPRKRIAIVHDFADMSASATASTLAKILSAPNALLDLRVKTIDAELLTKQSAKSSLSTFAMVFTLGDSVAAQLSGVAESLPNTQFCFASLHNPNALGLSNYRRNRYMSLRINYATYIEKIARYFPEAHNIAVLYSARSESAMREVEVAAIDSQFNIIAKPVESTSQIPLAVSSMSSGCDALLGIPDATIFNQNTAQGILLRTFRANIPMFGVSRPWVRAGALYALDWDYATLGEVYAEHCINMLSDKEDAPTILPNGDAALGHYFNATVGEHYNVRPSDHEVGELTFL